MRSLFRILWTATRDAVDDDVLTLAAALAFYTSLSLAPLVLLLMWILGLLGVGAAERLIGQVHELIGSDGAAVVRGIVENGRDAVRLDSLSGAIGLLTLLFSASAVFSQLQRSINLVWGIEARPERRIWGWLRRRLLSMAMFGTLAFLSLVSLLASTAMELVSDWIGRDDPLPLVSLLASLLVFVLLFAMVFQFLPDARVAWRDVWFGAATTAVLFTAGKHLIGMYLAHRSIGTSYGAAGSVVVLLAWVFFSSVLVLFGAEITQAWAHEHGRRLRPYAHAKRSDPDA